TLCARGSLGVPCEPTRYSSSLQSPEARSPSVLVLFFFTETATTEIYTLSLHDALPISQVSLLCSDRTVSAHEAEPFAPEHTVPRSEEHTSELQSRSDLVCRLLLEKKKRKQQRAPSAPRDAMLPPSSSSPAPDAREI